MCGIAGIVATSGERDVPSVAFLRTMIAAIRHRGPDEFGMYRDSRAGLVHARLSLIDLASGQQPLTNERENLWIVFNGEIFNYIEIRRDLEAHGHQFRTKSDTEVIVHAYEEWGTDCFSRFNGQWALALWDSETHRLVLSRDRIGVRPLFVQEGRGCVRFASEVKAIFTDPDVPRAFNLHGLDQTFTYWASLAPTGVFAGVEELQPGSVRSYEPDGSHRDFVYWRPSYAVDDSLTLNRASDRLRERLATATALRMVRADVPVGSYLSGGIDSSLIARMGRDAKEGDFRTFSIRFEDAEFDETPYQRMMASTLQSNHTDMVVRRSDIARVFPDVVFHAERPLMRTAPAPMFLLSGLVREAGIKAVLTGEGADEMLAGYDLFREAKIREFWSRRPDSLWRHSLFDRLYPYLARSPQQARGMSLAFWKKGLERAGLPGFSHAPRWSTTSAVKRFFTDEVNRTIAEHPAPDVLDTLPPGFSDWDTLCQAQYLEIVTLLSGYLISSQGDRMLMAHSVEGRFPFLDANVMEFCNSLPPRYKLLGLDEKHILKRIARGVIPEGIIDRQKQPYRAPDAISFADEPMPAYVGDVLSPGAIRAAGVFDAGRVEGLLTKTRARSGTTGRASVFSNTDNMAFVGILSTQLLHNQLLVNPRRPRSDDIVFTTMVDRIASYSQEQSG